MKNKNVLFVCPSYPDLGGVETVTGLLADFFLAEGLEVFILISDSEKTASRFLDRHAGRITPMKGVLNSRENLHFIEHFIREKEIACVINQGIFSLIHRRSGLHTDVLFVNTLHNKPFWELDIFRLSTLTQLLAKETTFCGRSKIVVRFALNYLRSGWSHPFIHSFYRKQIEDVSHFVVLDPNYKITLENSLYQGRMQEKITVIPNPVVIPLESTAARKNQVIWVGRLSAVQKRADRMLRIWKDIQSEVPDWELLIIGEGDQRPELEETALRLELTNTRFMGAQNTQPFYEQASILCLTSSYEGLPMVLLEAQSHGVVPLSFDCADAIHTILDSGKNGVVVASFDEKIYARELLNLIKNESLRNTMSRNARERAQKYALEKMGQKWLDLFQAE